MNLNTNLEVELNLIDLALQISREEIQQGKTHDFRETLHEIKQQSNS